MDTKGDGNLGIAVSMPNVAAQHVLACWSQAWTQIANGMLAAATAEMDLVREALRPPFASTDFEFRSPHAAAHAWVHASRQRFEQGVKTLRRLNDELAVAIFRAADTLATSLEAESNLQPAPPAREPLSKVPATV